MAQEYIPDLMSRDMAETPAAGLMPEYAKDWLQGLAVNPSEMMYESLTNQMGGGQPLAQIAERSGAKNLGAFLHRTIDPEEFEAIEYLFKHPKTQREVATSIITPTHRSFFHPTEPAPGIIMSVKNPENIKWMSQNDVFSVPYEEHPFRRQQIMDRLERKLKEMTPPGMETMPDDPMRYLKYQDAYNRVNSLPQDRVVSPFHDAYLPDEGMTIKKLLGKQQRRLEELATIDPNMESSHFYELINEVGYRMDPSEIVGVRVPRRSTKKTIDPELKELVYQEDIGPAIEFVRRHNLPIWQFEPQLTPGEAARGIEHYLNWGIKPSFELNQWGEDAANYPAAIWYKRTTPEFPMGLVESTADPLAKYYGRELRR